MNHSGTAFRPLENKDVDPLLALLNELPVQAKQFFHPHPFTKETLEQNCSSTDHYYVMINHEKIIGYSFLRLFGTKIPSFGCCIRKGFTHQGYGTNLTKWTLNQAKNLGYQKVILKVYRSNTVAYHLYQKVGFQQTSEVPETDEVRMEILL